MVQGTAAALFDPLEIQRRFFAEHPRAKLNVVHIGDVVEWVVIFQELGMTHVIHHSYVVERVSEGECAANAGEPIIVPTWRVNGSEPIDREAACVRIFDHYRVFVRDIHRIMGVPHG